MRMCVHATLYSFKHHLSIFCDMYTDMMEACSKHDNNMAFFFFFFLALIDITKM